MRSPTRRDTAADFRRGVDRLACWPPTPARPRQPIGARWPPSAAHVAGACRFHQLRPHHAAQHRDDSSSKPCANKEGHLLASFPRLSRVVAQFLSRKSKSAPLTDRGSERSTTRCESRFNHSAAAALAAACSCTNFAIARLSILPDPSIGSLSSTITSAGNINSDACLLRA
jgi:hypothetical protein